MNKTDAIHADIKKAERFKRRAKSFMEVQEEIKKSLAKLQNAMDGFLESSLRYEQKVKLGLIN